MGSAYQNWARYRQEAAGGSVDDKPLGREPIAHARRLVAPEALCGRCLAAPARWQRWICGPCEVDIQARAAKRAVKAHFTQGKSQLMREVLG